MTKFRAVLALAAALVLSACYPPMSKYPVGGTAAKPDPVLVGLWKGTPADTNERGVYFHFLPRQDGTITLMMVQAGNQPDGDWYFATLTTAKLGANHFMNARLILSNGIQEGGDPAVQPAGTVPVLYRIDAKGEMSAFTMDEDKVKAAIASGKIKGTVEKGTLGDAVITADPAALDKFVQSQAGLSLFSKLLFTLHKME